MEHCSFLVWILMLITIVETGRPNSKQRFKVLEMRLRTIESRLNIEAEQKWEELEHIVESISIINTTISDLYDKLAETDVNQMTEDNMNTDDSDVLDNQCTVRMVKAFKNEKLWLRKAVDSIEKQQVILVKQLKQSLIEEIRNITTVELTNIKRELQNDLRNIKTEVEQNNNDRQLVESVMRIDATHNKMTKKLANQERQIMECLETQKDIQLEIKKIKHDMAKTDQDQNANPRNSKTCPNGWDKNNNFCYKFFDELMTNREAVSRCADYGAHLVDIQDGEENEFLYSLVDNGTYHEYWIGLRETSTGSLAWDRTESVAHYTGPLLPLLGSSGRYAEYCVIAYKSGDQSLVHWLYLSCNYKSQFVCKKVT